MSWSSVTGAAYQSFLDFLKGQVKVDRAVTGHQHERVGVGLLEQSNALPLCASVATGLAHLIGAPVG